MLGRWVIRPSEPAYYIEDCRISSVTWWIETVAFMTGKNPFVMLVNEQTTVLHALYHELSHSKFMIKSEVKSLDPLV